jgi:hypothetical protein
MKELSNLVDIKDDDGNQLFSGSFVVKIPKRAERCALQMAAMNVGKLVKEDTTKYFEFSEKLLNDHLVSIDVDHIPSGTKINERDQLEYMETENLISLICSAVIGGQKLGKTKA